LIEQAKAKLRDLAEARLSLYTREMGREFYDRLLANKANWRAGYLPAQDCFAVFPQTDKGQVIVGPFTVVKLTHVEIWRDIGTEEMDALRGEARQAGFEHWAAP
jgi:hypothetical protein